jgi:hypothetical protein
MPCVSSCATRWTGFVPDSTTKVWRKRKGKAYLVDEQILRWRKKRRKAMALARKLKQEIAAHDKQASLEYRETVLSRSFFDSED